MSPTHTNTVEIDGIRLAWKSDEGDVPDVGRFDVAAGERACIEVQSGSESTLLILLGVVVSSREGTVRILGARISETHRG